MGVGQSSPLDEDTVPMGSACPQPPRESLTGVKVPHQARSQQGTGVGLQCIFWGHDSARNPMLPLLLHQEHDH